MTAPSRYRILLDSLRQRVPALSPAQAFRWLREGQGLFIDIRHPRQWIAGHIPKAISVDFAQFPGEIEAKIPNEQTLLLCYSRVGDRSLLAADLLIQMGFTAAHSLAGGWDAWQNAGLPVESGVLPPCRRPEERLAGIAQLPHLIDSIRNFSAGFTPSIASFVRKEDRALMDFLCVDAQTMEHIVLSANSDAEIVTHLKRVLGPSWPSDHAIREFNLRTVQRRSPAAATDDL